MDERNEQNATVNADSLVNAESSQSSGVTEEASRTRDDDQKEKPVKDLSFNALLAEAISTTCFRTNDAGAVKTGMRDILRTISTMSMQQETAIGIVVGGILYRFSDYRATRTLANLVAPAKIVVTDVITAKDFLNRAAYEDKIGKVLDPASFELTLRNVCRMLRVNPSLAPIQRPECMLLSEATKYAVNGRKVVDSNQDRVLFLTQSFDSEADYSLEFWAKQFASRGLE